MSLQKVGVLTARQKAPKDMSVAEPIYEGWMDPICGRTNNPHPPILPEDGVLSRRALFVHAGSAHLGYDRSIGLHTRARLVV